MSLDLFSEKNDILAQTVKENSLILDHESLEQPILLTNSLAEEACLRMVFGLIDKLIEENEIIVYLPNNYGRILGLANRELESYARHQTGFPLQLIETEKPIFFLSIIDDGKSRIQFDQLVELYSRFTQPKWICAFSSTENHTILSPYKFDGRVFDSASLDSENFLNGNVFLELGEELLKKGYKFSQLPRIFQKIGIPKKNIAELDLIKLQRLLIEP